ncbi:MAG TPA: hypothetical protein VMN36_04005 [Verrucomicrobiales bacterium]|nr:hypothetical protein [Verrucomicrobiales bacterium]
MAAMLSRRGKRGYAVEEEAAEYGVDPDFDLDEKNSQPDAGLNGAPRRD